MAEPPTQRPPVTCYVGVGSNIEPQVHVPAALEGLLSRMEVTGSSTFYRTAPAGRPEQADYVNGVWAVRTHLAPGPLKALLRELEVRLGRRRTADRFASRTIDLDLLLHGDTVRVGGGLDLPDPDVRHRAFVAVPLLELAPELRLPDTGEPLARVVDRLGTDGLEALEALEALTAALRTRLATASGSAR
ncbi:MAG: 2-amino-4-hydroxy-6-hydroxymethyldihydropteridine diphosphokinase [bacterium]